MKKNMTEGKMGKEQDGMGTAGWKKIIEGM